MGVVTSFPLPSGDCLEIRVGETSVGVETSRAFGARSRGVCHVLLVGAGDDFAVVEFDGRANAEFAVRGVGALVGVACEVDKQTLFVVELVVGDGKYFG